MLLLGVDAGGTKTTALVVESTNEYATRANVLGRGDGGPGNPLRHGSEVAFGNVLAAVAMACEQAGVTSTQVRAAVVGMAGAGAESEQNEAAEFLRQRTQISNLTVVPDFKIVLPAAFPLGGVAIIAGTGSVAHGLRSGNETRVGGHGYLVDDGGSGFWLGRRALQAMVRSSDGRGPMTSLTDAVCQSLQQPDPKTLLTDILKSPDRIAKIAAIAPFVVAATAIGDATSAKILDDAAIELASLVIAACRNVEYSHQQYALALAGSVLTKTDAVRDRLLSVLSLNKMSPQSIEVVTEPVFGAIQLAAAVVGF